MVVLVLTGSVLKPCVVDTCSYEAVGVAIWWRIESLHAIGCRWSTNACAQAAKNGRLEVLQYLQMPPLPRLIVCSICTRTDVHVIVGMVTSKVIEYHGLEGHPP